MTRNRTVGRSGRAVVLAGVLCAVPAIATGQSGMRRVEFQAAVREALEKNPSVGQAVIAIARADALVAQARSLTVPSVQLGLTNTTLDSARGFSGGVTQPQNQFAFTGTVRYQVGGFLAVEQAQDDQAVATASAAEVRQAIGVAAAQAYLTIIAAKRQVDVAERSRATAQAHFDYADRRFAAGAGSRLNRLRAEQAVTGASIEVEAARLAVTRAQEALGVALASDGPVDAGAEPALAIPSDTGEQAWSASRPDLLTQAAIRRAAERVVQKHVVQEWAPLPVLSFDPQVVTPAGLFQPSRTWRFTISMVQPIFDGGRRKASFRLKQAAVDASALTFTGIQVRARSEVRVAEEAQRSLDRSLTEAQSAVNQARDVLTITTAAFEVGATTNIEVIDAQRSLRDAESRVASLEDAARRVRLDLLIAIGKFNP